MDFSNECKVIGDFLGSFSQEEQDAAMEYCDNIYLSTFQAGDFTAQSEPEMRSELIDFVCGASIMYDEEDEEISFPSREEAEKIVDGGQVFAWLVNYKGEGEGFAKKEDVSNLLVFVERGHYA